MRIIYMGTPDFAVESLRALLQDGHEIAAVVTMPDKPAGRGHKMQASTVKQYAQSVGLPVLQPERLKDEAFISQLRSYKADLQVVVAFRMLPEVVWSMPPRGTINLHASLLPQYRGAAPINWAIINGETETGVTTFFLQHEIDTGNIIMQQRVQIGPDENVGSVHDRLMSVGARLICQTVRQIEDGTAPSVPQAAPADAPLHPAPKIFKETCEINFSRTSAEVHNHVRGLSPYPGAWCMLRLTPATEPVQVKIFEVEPVASPTRQPAGTVSTDGRTYLHIATADGHVSVLSMQLPGKRRMNVRDVLNGLH